jgi:hypothetical protein
MQIVFSSVLMVINIILKQIKVVVTYVVALALNIENYMLLVTF